MFESPKFTPRNVAKFAAKSTVATIVAKAVKDVIIAKYPQAETLNAAGLAGTVTGWYVSEKLEPYTDDLVDYVADEYVEFVNKRKQNKTIA